MAITFVGADAGGGNIADISTMGTDSSDPLYVQRLAWPTVANGDFAIIWWAMQNTVTPTIPGGWTVALSNDTTTGSGRGRLMTHVCDGTETGFISLTNSGGTINRQSAIILVYRGALGLDGTPTVRNETVSSTTHAAPSYTTTAANASILTFVMERSSNVTTGWTPPGGYTERADSGTYATGSGGTIVAGADDGLAVVRSSGATVSPGSWSSNSATGTANVATVTVGLAPVVTATFSGWGVPIN